MKYAIQKKNLVVPQILLNKKFQTFELSNFKHNWRTCRPVARKSVTSMAQLVAQWTELVAQLTGRVAQLNELHS